MSQLTDQEREVLEKYVKTDSDMEDEEGKDEQKKEKVADIIFGEFRKHKKEKKKSKSNEEKQKDKKEISQEKQLLNSSLM